MANTKVTGDLIASSTIATGNIADNAVTSDKISGITTAHITEGANLYYTDARADARITAATTSDLSEGTNLYYTDARADARAALLVDSAPSTLNTLNELAAALGDDPNFATTVTNSIATKMPIAGGTFTGNVSVNGEARVYTDSNFGYWGVDAGNSYVYLGTNSSAYGLSLQTGGVDRVNINSAGNATFAGNVTLTTANADTVLTIGTSASGGIDWDIQSASSSSPYAQSSGDLLFRNASSNVLILGNNGNATFAGMITVNGDGIDIDNNDNLRLRFDHASVFKAGLQVATSAGDMITSSATNDFAIRSQSNMLFATGGSTEKMRISSDGNVTIGSSTLTGPRSLTLLSATNATNYDINFQQAGTTNFGRIRFTEGAADFQFIPQVGQGPNLTLKYGGNSFFSRGNVGIGETTPDQKLNVREDGGSDVFRGIEVHNNDQSQARAGICFKAYDWVQSAIWHGRTSTAAYAGALVLGTNPDTSDLSVSGVTGRMWILNNGNVGIGINSPDAKFHVQGNVKVGSAAGASWTDAQDDVGGLDVFVGSGSNAFTVWDDNAQTAPRFAVSRAGFVGVGGLAGVKFEVYSGSLRVRGDASNVIELSNINGNTRATLGQYGNEGDLSLYRSNNVKHVYLSSYYDSYINPGNGNLGIGTDSPTAKLDINGTVRYRGSTYNQLTYQVTGSYSANTWYTAATTATLTESGIYILVVYLNDFSAGGGNYYIHAASTNFYWDTTTTNRVTAFNFPPLLGTGHATGNIPLIRITQEMGSSGAQSKIQWQNSYTYTNLTANVSGKQFTLLFKKIGG